MLNEILLQFYLMTGEQLDRPSFEALSVQWTFRLCLAKVPSYWVPSTSVLSLLRWFTPQPSLPYESPDICCRASPFMMTALLLGPSLFNHIFMYTSESGVSIYASMVQHEGLYPIILRLESDPANQALHFLVYSHATRAYLATPHRFKQTN